MGLKMSSKVDADFLRGLFMGIPIPVVRGGLHWGMLISVVLPLEENSVGNRVWEL